MQPQKLSENWLFATHSEQTIREWVRQLRYFYFKRAWGGHANDGDEFQAAFSYTDKHDLLQKLKELNVELSVVEESEKGTSKIQQFPEFAQPGHVILFGQKVFLWVNDNAIQITVSGTKDGNSYEVTEDDFNVCLALEKHFDYLGWHNAKDTSLEENVCCISQKKYPELYSAENSKP